MARANTYLPFTGATDAGFRDAAAELHQLMQDAGFVVASDTGQVDISVMVRPALSTYAGFKMYRTNDGLAPIYIKIEFGVGVSNTRTRFAVTAGMATNGAGAFTGGAVTVRHEAYESTAIAGTFQSYACAIPGVSWVAFKCGALLSGTAPIISFAVFRFCDDSGAPTDHGFVLYSGHSSAPALLGQQVRASPTLLVSSTAFTYCLLPGDIPSAVVGVSLQFWRHFAAQPQIAVNPFVFTCDCDAVPATTQRLMPMPNGDEMNFISVGLNAFKNTGIGAATAAKHGLMLPWVA